MCFRGALCTLVNLADFSLAVTGCFEEVLRLFDRVLLRLRLDDREPGNQLLRLGERSVGHRELASGEPDARTQGAWQASLSSEQRARFHSLFDQLAHLGHFPLAWWSAFRFAGFV